MSSTTVVMYGGTRLLYRLKIPTTKFTVVNQKYRAWQIFHSLNRDRKEQNSNWNHEVDLTFRSICYYTSVISKYTRIVFLRKNRCLLLLEIKNITKFNQLCFKGNNYQNLFARDMVLLYDTSSECTLPIYEVSLKYL